MIFKLDNVTKQGTEFVAYIKVMDGEKVIHTTSLVFKNKEDFKVLLKKKTAEIKAECDEKEIKKVEIKQALIELEVEF